MLILHQEMTILKYGVEIWGDIQMQYVTDVICRPIIMPI